MAQLVAAYCWRLAQSVAVAEEPVERAVVGRKSVDWLVVEYLLGWQAATHEPEPACLAVGRVQHLEPGGRLQIGMPEDLSEAVAAAVWMIAVLLRR